jgi:hypothetical protein
MAPHKASHVSDYQIRFLLAKKIEISGVRVYPNLQPQGEPGRTEKRSISSVPLKSEKVVIFLLEFVLQGASSDFENAWPVSSFSICSGSAAI